MEIIATNTAVLHALTGTHPVMTNEQFNVLRESIKDRGQDEPVLVYRGKIVDGRHRLRAIKELGIDSIKIERLNNNMTLEEVKSRVASTEQRRHQSSTQLAINAYRLYMNGVNQPEAAKRAGASVSNLKYVCTLHSLGRDDIVELLWSGGKYDVSMDGRFKKPTDSLAAILTKVKYEIATMNALVEDGGSRVDSKGKRNAVPLTKLEIESYNAISAMVKAWPEELRKKMIAELYRIDNEADGAEDDIEIG